MKVLILGGTGMLGHKVWQVFEPVFDTWMTVRMSVDQCMKFPFLNPSKVIENINANTFESVERVVNIVRPQVIINCIGIVKKLKESESPIPAITINSLLPHWLEELSISYDIRLIHISTDCVFSGKKGNYNEEDLSDAYDLYGRTKLLGEVTGKNSMTIRTSMIGYELQRAVGLLEWFLSQRGGKIKGYKNAIFSGFTTSVLAEILSDIILNHPYLSGLYHVSSNPISKFELLNLIKKGFQIDIEIEPDEDFLCNRSLDSSKFRTKTKYHPPTWEEMVKQLKEEAEKYETRRK